MADTLQEMAVFARVVGAGSLSAAARELSVSTAVVSRRLAALESRLGADNYETYARRPDIQASLKSLGQMITPNH